MRKMSIAILARMAERLNRRQRRRSAGPALPPLILMTDEGRLADPVPALAALPPGAAVILRHYRAADRVALARRLKLACRRSGLRLIIAAAPGERGPAGALAARIGADGVHLPERLVGRPRWRRPGWLVTAAAHGPAGLRRARRADADAALLSPVFPSESHPGARVLGPLRFAAWARRAPLPVYALGGVDAVTARRLAGSNAVGVAGIGFADGPARRQ